MRRIFISISAVSAAAVLVAHAGCGTSQVAPDAARPAAVAASVPVAAPAKGPAKLSFNEHIQPILAENCFHCHGPDSGTRKAKLRLDRAEFATVDRGDAEAAIVPGKPDVSPLIERMLATDPDEIMPPPEAHKTMKPAEIALLKRWIAEGAEYQEHWSFLPPVVKPPALPSGSQLSALNSQIPANPIDGYILAKLREENLTPSPPESPARLLRRVTLDLTGLPPTPAELAAFTRDPSPAAYERAVDRLLASDASAEHFGRQWLDAVRYADTHGIHIDNYRSIWPYRDWVINAFKQNMPFDRFTIEQMAGDLLPEATVDQKVASGFNRCLPTTSEGGAIAAEYEAIYAKDRVETMSTVWLGLTTGCAACHDHKFDPISTKDFYALTAFFRNNTMPAMDGNVSDTRPSLFIPAVADRAEWTRVQAKLETVRAAQKTRTNAAGADFTAWLATARSLAVPPKDYATPLHVPLVGLASKSPAGSDAPVAGPYGPAIRLDGAPLTLGAPIPLRREQSDSIDLLVRVTEQPSGPLISSCDAGAAGAGWEVFLDQGKIGVRLRGGRADFSSRGVAATALQPGVWHHVLFTFDSGSWSNRSVEVYVDGKQGASAGNINHVPADIVPTAPLVLGARADAPLGGGGVWVQDVRHHRRGFTVAQAKAKSAVIETHAALAAEPTARTPAQAQLLREHFFNAADGPSLQLHAQFDDLLATEAALRRRGGITLVMEEKKDTEAFAHVLTRGEYTQLGEKIAATTPAILPPLPADAPRNRLSLARWLVDAKNPLTARVTVNRTWQHLFGSGLVESAGDFGVTGSRPSHPELLDWLAVEFRESGWDYRRLVKLTVTSATYRQSAVATPALLERDPVNRLLARGPRHRLDAEQLRDQALAASGLLVAKLGGHPVRPYQPEGIWEDVAMKESTTRYYRQDSGENLYRRSLYTLIKRTALAPSMDILNAPNREVSCVRRDRTNTPLQALVTLNEPLFVEASRALATRALHAASSVDARLDFVSLNLIGRPFEKAERAIVRRTLDDALATYRRTPVAALELLDVGESPADTKLPAPELAAWTLVASQVLNLDESLTK